MIDAKHRELLRCWIRQAILESNKRFRFSCKDCRHCDRGSDGMPECLQDIMPIPDYTLRMATHVLPCFEVGIHREDNPYCIMLTKMVYYHIPFEDADRGWYTIVSRITARSSRTGHLLSVKSRNLQRMG